MIVSPSILSADFSRLGKEIKSLEKAGADWIHMDVMDGVFVPNISFGAPVIKSLRKTTSIPFDAHLMIENPGKYVEAFADAGADIITIHIEADSHVHRTLTRIKELGVKAGISLNPGTPVHMLNEVLQYVDLVLVMSVNPGFAAQKLIETSYSKVKAVKKAAEKLKNRVLVEVDGGINETTAPLMVDSGADALVAGSYVFKHDNYEEPIKRLRGLNK